MQGHAHRPETVNVTYRRMHFDFEHTGFPKYWHDDSPFISLFWDALSTAFPPGEKFFIDSARAARDRIQDEALREELASFCQQEGHHTFQHRKLNRMVGEQGFELKRLEARFARPLDRVRAKTGVETMLAVTMALEHFTAGFAQEYLGNPAISQGADPNVRALWAWHAVEEAEHKATCFDIYERLGGGYFRRVTVLPAAWFLLISITLRNTFDLLRQDRQLGNVSELVRGLRYLLGRRGLITRMLPRFFAYFRPGFHPWRYDDSSLANAWLADNARYIEAKGLSAAAE